MQESLVIYSLSTAPAHVHLHLWSGIAAVIIGTIVMLMRKGTQKHRILGRIWVTLMLSLAISALFIKARGHFSMLHVFSVAVIIFLPAAIYAARKGKIKFHRYTMISVFSGLIIAGAFTLLPYRILGQLIFK
ncbi:MAG: DUF2306 domain-containing protein [Cellvibrionaceae bacterium]